MTQVWRWSTVEHGWVQTFDGDMELVFVIQALSCGWFDSAEGDYYYDDTWFIVP